MAFMIGDCIILTGDYAYIAMPQNGECCVDDYIKNQHHTRKMRSFKRDKYPNASFIVLEIKGEYVMLLMNDGANTTRVFSMISEEGYIKI